MEWLLKRLGLADDEQWVEEDPCDCGTVMDRGFYVTHAAGMHPDCTGLDEKEPYNRNYRPLTVGERLTGFALKWIVELDEYLHERAWRKWQTETFPMEDRPEKKVVYSIYDDGND